MRLLVLTLLLSWSADVGLRAQEHPHALPSHTGTSKYSSGVDSTCNWHRITNHTYRLTTTKSYQDVLLDVTEAVEQTTCAEGQAESTAVVVRSAKGSSTPITRFAAHGTADGPYEHEALFRAAFHEALYGITSHGCCDVGEATQYFDLRTGSRRFVHSGAPPFFIANGTVRYLAVHPWGTAVALPQLPQLGHLVAIVQYGTGRSRPARVAVISKDSSDYRFLGLRLEGPQASSTDTTIVLAGTCCSNKDTVAVSGVTAVVTFGLYASDAPVVHLRLPIVNDSLSWTAATLPKELSVRPLSQ